MAEVDTDSVEFKQVQDFLKTEVERYASAAFEKQQATAQQQSIQRQQTDQDIAKQQMADLINPFVEPSINQAKFAAADSNDRVDFYVGADSDVLSYKDEVEKQFKLLSDQGRALPRKEILRYLRGKEFETDPEAFTAKQLERKKRQVEYAEYGADIGHGGVKTREDSKYQGFDSKTADEMEKVLEGVTF